MAVVGKIIQETEMMPEVFSNFIHLRWTVRNCRLMNNVAAGQTSLWTPLLEGVLDMNSKNILVNPDYGQS